MTENSNNSTATATEHEIAKTKKVAKKPATKKATKKSRVNGKTIICTPQMRILNVLSKHKNPLDGATLTEKAEICTRAWLSEYLGCKESENGGYIMKAGERTNVRKLVPAGLVEPIDVEGRNEYVITEKGRKALIDKK